MSSYNERIDPWLQVLWDQQGSDLLLVSGSKPRVRIDGGLRPLESAPVLTGSEISDLVHDMLSPDQEAILDGAPRRRLLTDLARQGPAARQRVPPEGRVGAGTPNDPLRDSEL